MKDNIIVLVVFVYLIIMNFIGLFIMKTDKSRAKKHAWRIRESTLFAVSIIGGSLGTWAGMYIFRHKTKHWYFVVGMPLIFILHVFAIVMVHKVV